MEDNENLQGGGKNERLVPEGQAVPLSRRAWLEFKELLADAAFPFIVMLVLSTMIILFADYSDDLGVSLAALIGGEIMFTAALVIFGRANGSTAYGKTVLNNQKRELGSTEEKVVCRTGEYALWKGALVAAMICVPFIIVQIIELCYANVYTGFCLKYMFGWAYYPFSYLGKSYQALNFIMILLPLTAHTVGYHLGKLHQIKIQQAIAERKENKKRRKK